MRTTICIYVCMCCSFVCPYPSGSRSMPKSKLCSGTTAHHQQTANFASWKPILQMRFSTRFVVLSVLVLSFDALAIEDQCGSSDDTQCKDGHALHLLQTKAHVQRAKSSLEQEEPLAEAPLADEDDSEDMALAEEDEDFEEDDEDDEEDEDDGLALLEEEEEDDEDEEDDAANEVVEGDEKTEGENQFWWRRRKATPSPPPPPPPAYCLSAKMKTKCSMAKKRRTCKVIRKCVRCHLC
eukprot:gnl/TRDRNA2_/TRDRNA2_153651_c0_seq2.p1 gnl/TRDRNA2_/TRDRNA2_153651_c0~~gnl/TRDRNA2_/TRDRNA2_153651_c0_seq2.p1  ORF type:complete len:238 (+),score=47.34 gnl/TRDRNA2_/TRDRNA2_153651_c0_seq2:1-714(+)